MAKQEVRIERHKGEGPDAKSPSSPSSEASRIFPRLTLCDLRKLSQLADRVEAIEGKLAESKPGDFKGLAQPANIQSDLLTVPEFCARYRISRSALYGDIAAGTGPKVTRRKRRVFIRVGDADEWFAKMNGSTPSVAPPAP